ncbi:MAG: helix-turn-helix transcriptional regulator [Acidobacteria bacterium]|nr:helix-turn-helix transcriptional regulator [Acidobacteriota bacterium]
MKGAGYRQRYREFLAKLRRARQQAGFTQVDVARRLGQHQSFVSKIESGERRLDVIELQAFADLYGKPLSYFVK